MTVKYFNYQIIEEKPIVDLHLFKDHRRLRVFYEKGCTCVNCGLTATKIIKGFGRGQEHWDLYNDNLEPLTVDHIYPKSRGGSDDLDNLQPMCYACNHRKGNKLPGEKQAPVKKKDTISPFLQRFMKKNNFIKPEKFEIGQVVWGKSSTMKGEKRGLITSFGKHPYTGKASAFIGDKPFHLKTLFIKDENNSTK